MTRRRRPMAAPLPRTLLGVDYRDWAVAVPLGIALLLVGWALASGAIVVGGAVARP